jgi:hypothetical protein
VFARFLKEKSMSNGLKTIAIVAALVAGTASGAMAQGYGCPAGYAPYNGVCQPVANNPVSGAAQGAAAGAAAGGATGGPVGAVVGGAIGTATGAVGGAVGAVTPVPACAPGYAFYNGACYPAR